VSDIQMGANVCDLGLRRTRRTKGEKLRLYVGLGLRIFTPSLVRGWLVSGAETKQQSRGGYPH
jgi:hypothetical protein